MFKSSASGYALVVGVGGDLPGTTEDARALADILTAPDLCAYPPNQVELLTGSAATRAAVLDGLDRLAETAEDATVVVYFSGHGYSVSSMTRVDYFLFPHDYDLNDLSATCISGDEFVQKLRAIRARTLLVLLDCCRAGGIGEPKAPGLTFAKSPMPPEMEVILAEGQGRVVIASSREDEFSYAGEPYSAFTVALLESLSGKGVDVEDGYVRVADLALHAREMVPRRTSGKQHPTIKTHQAENVPIAYYAGGAKEPQPLTFSLDPETAAVLEPPAQIGLRGAQVGGSVVTGDLMMRESTFVGGDKNMITGHKILVGIGDDMATHRPAIPGTDGLGDQPNKDVHILRYSDVSFPSHAVVQRPEALRIVITLKPISEQAVGLALQPPIDETEPMRVDACVVVSSFDFDLASPNVQTIEVPLGADSDPVVFKLVPKSIGRKQIAVEFFQDTRYLGRAEVETTVGEEEGESRLVSAQSVLGLSSSQLPPDLTILFDRVVVGEDRHYYRYRLLSYKHELNLWFEEFNTPETSAMPQGILKETFAHLNRMHSETIDNEALFFERLNSIGTSLYGRLFPDDLKALYWDKLRDQVKSIVIISYEPWVPWELVRPFHPETKQAADGFLCEKFDLTRWLHGTAPPDIISLERLGLIVAMSDVELAASEAAEIKELFGDKAEDVSPASETVFQLLKTGGFSGLHFACHGEYNTKDPDWSSLYLEEGRTLCPIDIDGDKLVFGRDHPLVFLNACETGQGGYALTGMGGWAEAFVRRAKSSGFIGSIWEANSESAYKFAVAFYRNLLAGRTVARAARLARHSIKRAGDPTWLSYTVYANPLARLAVEEAASP